MLVFKVLRAHLRRALHRIFIAILLVGFARFALPRQFAEW
jgi:hypothetical protein